MTKNNDLIIDISEKIRVVHAGQFTPGNGWIFPGRAINDYELIYVKKGELHISEDGNEFVVKPGETLILHPDKWHEGIKKCHNLTFDWVHFIPHKLGDVNLIGDNNHNVLRVPQHKLIQRKSRLIELFSFMKNDTHTGLSQVEITRQLLKLIFFEVAYGNVLRNENHEEYLADQIMIHISEKAFTQLTTSVIAKHFKYNPDYIGRVFKKVFKHNITEEITRRRMVRAKHMLQTSLISIAEIAEMCAYDDVSYFCRMFKNREKITPLKFRNKFRIKL